MKKFISVFLSLAMVLTMFASTPLTALAEVYETIDGITYYVDTETGEAEVNDANALITTANILSEVNGYKVTIIGVDAFKDCTALTTVTIPDSVITVGGWAFSGCKSLTAVTIPNSVTSIANNAFEMCTSLTEITIPDSVTEISYRAFSNCVALTEITISDSVTSFAGGMTFYNTAYYNDETNWENGVLYIGDYLVAAKKTHDEESDNDIKVVDLEVKGNYTIKDGTNLIADSAFECCNSLTSVTIPDSVTNIGSWAFRSCTSITTVTIPNSVTNIGEEAFGYYYDYYDLVYKKVENFTIYGYADTAAETYANKNGFTFIELEQGQPKFKGDTNGDGKISVADARKLVVAIAKGDTQALLEFGDVNGDGKISVADARKIVVAIAKNDFNF